MVMAETQQVYSHLTVRAGSEEWTSLLIKSTTDLRLDVPPLAGHSQPFMFARVLLARLRPDHIQGSGQLPVGST
jgi:hypothetical protein